MTVGGGKAGTHQWRIVLVQQASLGNRRLCSITELLTKFSDSLAIVLYRPDPDDGNNRKDFKMG
jgi:hypothetical protein